MGYLSVIAGVLGVLIKLYMQFWSSGAILARLKERQASIQGRIDAERAALERDYQRIKDQPDKTDQALLDSLNRKGKP